MDTHSARTKEGWKRIRGRKRIGRNLGGEEGEMQADGELYTAAKLHYPAAGGLRRRNGGPDMMACGGGAKPKGAVKITLRGHFSFLRGGGGGE